MEDDSDETGENEKAKVEETSTNKDSSKRSTPSGKSISFSVRDILELPGKEQTAAAAAVLSARAGDIVEHGSGSNAKEHSKLIKSKLVPRHSEHTGVAQSLSTPATSSSAAAAAAASGAEAYGATNEHTGSARFYYNEPGSASGGAGAANYGYPSSAARFDPTSVAAAAAGFLGPHSAFNPYATPLGKS